MSSPLESIPVHQQSHVDDGQVSSIEKQFQQQKKRHVEVLTVSSCVLLFLLMLNTDSKRVTVSWWPNFPIPELCLSRSWLGLNCPGCGLTRSCIAIRNGEFVQAWQYHHLGWLMLLLIASQIPYRIYALRTLRGTPSQSQWPSRVSYIVIAALFINWVVGLCMT